jgi:hypothetical protein
MDSLSQSKLNTGPRGCAMTQAVSSQPFTAESRVRSKVSPFGIYGAQNDTETGFPPCFILSVSLQQCSILVFIYHQRYIILSIDSL